MRLLGAQSAGPDLGRLLKRVAHVVEQDKTEVSANPTQRRRRGPKFERIDEHPGPTNRITSLGVARTGGIDGKATMGSRAAGVQPLRQGNQLLIPISERALLSVASLARKHPVIPAKVVVAGIAQVDAAEVGLGTEFSIREERLRQC